MEMSVWCWGWGVCVVLGVVTRFIGSDVCISIPKPNNLFKDEQLSVKKQSVSTGWSSC